VKTTVMCLDEKDYVLDVVREYCSGGWALLATFTFYDKEADCLVEALTFEDNTGTPEVGT